MELTRSLIEGKAEEYREAEALYAVEEQHVEILPDTFAGSFGWRDAMWVVRWYYRRYLGDYPDDRRRAAEDAFGENDFGAIEAAIHDAVAAPDPEAKVERLTDLDGVDVPVASAFLMFADPEAYTVVGDREWAVLREAGELDGPYPDPPSVGEYVAYLETCRELGERFDADMWTLYRALWRLWHDLED